ncbi:MAG: hypothetical protein ACYCSH_01530 [Acidithiobacillus sp.]
MITHGTSTGGSRGCGSRKPGGVYLCTALSEDGSPIEDFLVDPVRPFHGEPFRAPILWNDISNPELFHAVIWVGAEFYPSLVDFVEEVKAKGASRRIPSNFDFSKLTPGASRMIFIHPKAFTTTAHLPANGCPKHYPLHGLNEPCIGAHWDYVQGLGGSVSGRTATLGDLQYAVPPQEDIMPLLTPGFFMALPITHVEYEAMHDADTGPETIHQASDLGFEVSILHGDAYEMPCDY